MAVNDIQTRRYVHKEHVREYADPNISVPMVEFTSESLVRGFSMEQEDLLKLNKGSLGECINEAVRLMSLTSETESGRGFDQDAVWKAIRAEEEKRSAEGGHTQKLL